MHVHFLSKSYCNSVLQSLYACYAFRECLIAFDPARGPLEISKELFVLPKDTLLHSLRDLFLTLKKQTKKSVVKPTQFVTTLKKENGTLDARLNPQNSFEIPIIKMLKKCLFTLSALSQIHS